MKIGIACYPSYGGSGAVASELGRMLKRRGHDVHMFSYRVPFKVDLVRDGLIFHEVRDPNYPLFEHPSYGMALASEMARVAKDGGLDLLHVHYAYPHSISAYLARQLAGNRKLPIVTTLHGTDITLVGKDPAYYDMVKFAIECSDGVTSVSEHLREATVALFHTSKPIRVIPNFVDTKMFHPFRRSRRSKKRLIHVSNFRPVKRVADIIRVFERVQRKVPAVLQMVGEGPDLQMAKDLARDLPVEFLGFRKEVPELIAQADAMLVASEAESFGLVALEAMACGVPVVATRCGGIEEVVRDGQTGLLADVGDIEGLAERASRVLTEPELACRMGKAGREVAEKEFEGDLIVSRYESLYKSLLR